MRAPGTTAVIVMVLLGSCGCASMASSRQVAPNSPENLEVSKDFVATSATFAGAFEVEAPATEVFALFSPLGERLWVPGWNPEILYPEGAEWQEEMLFRTRDETGDAVWIVTRLDPGASRVVYHRVEAERYVARVEVTCAPQGNESTEVRTTYGFVGLTTSGNREIAAMTEEAYAAKMTRWTRWIAAHFDDRQSRQTP